ncbi:P-loop containing nucleoside triphosphate hydrolase protein [Melampsora americana]|nr:P-loop containing nucleoside triphosphate hydrolase protein [Melampsora americana]
MNRITSQLVLRRNQNTQDLSRINHWNLKSRRWVWNTSSDPKTQNIFAAATPTHSKSALSIIRVDGPQASSLYYQMTSAITPIKHSNVSPHPSTLPPRTAKLRRIVDPFTKETLDPEAIVIDFPHRSTSTSSTFEFHLHGSPAIIKSVIHSLSRLPNFRVAQPGEFTQRRYERSMIQHRPQFDLNQLLALKNLIDAETEEQRKLAIHQFDGQFKQVYQSIRKTLLESMALCEAIIDFSEDGSIDDKSVWEEVSHKVKSLESIIQSHLNDSNRHEKVLNGIRLTLFGAPNVGKSTLLNWLVHREASIVSPHPGTTRDVIEISLDFHGFPIIVSDTAGLRDTQDPIEGIGIDRAKAT